MGGDAKSDLDTESDRFAAFSGNRDIQGIAGYAATAIFRDLRPIQRGPEKRALHREVRCLHGLFAEGFRSPGARVGNLR